MLQITRVSKENKMLVGNEIRQQKFQVFTTCQNLNELFYIASDFETKFYIASDFELKILRRVRS